MTERPSSSRGRECSLTEALRRLGRPVVFYPSLARLVGIEEAIFIAQLVYWTPRSKSEAGWVYKSAEDLEHETSLTYRQQRRVREELCGRGLLQERYARDEHRLYLRVIPEALDRLAPDGEAHDETSGAQVTKRHVPPDEREDGTLPNVGSYKEAESTSEITTERAAPARPSQDTRSGAVPQADSERQLIFQMKAVADEKSLPKAAWPSDPLRSDLFGGLHSGFQGKTGMHAIAKAFHDSQRLTFHEQLRECVTAALTWLTLHRNAKLGGLDTGRIEQMALGKLQVAGKALRSLELVKVFETRSRLVTQYVARVVTESAAEVCEVAGVDAAKIPGEAAPVSACAATAG